MKTNLCQMSMDAGRQLPMDYVIRWNLKKNHKLFKNCYIADGNMTKEAEQFYSQFENVVGINSPWVDSYAQQYRRSSQSAPEGDWCLYLDADEAPSESLLQFGLEPAISKDVNMVRLPCILYLSEDENLFYPVEPTPADEFTGQWTKGIFFKKTSTLNFIEHGSHVFPSHGNAEKAIYVPCPYFHFKTLQGFVNSDVEQAFLFPEGQHYSQTECIQFKTFTRQFKTMKEFRDATKNGKWPIALQKFSYNTRNIYDRPVSRLYWQYHILNGHPCFKDDPSLTWDVVKHHIQSESVMKLFEHNKANKIGEIVIEKDF